MGLWQGLLQSYDQVAAVMQQHCRKVAAVCFYHANEVCHKVAADLLQTCSKRLGVLWEKGLYKAKNMHAQALRDVAVLKCSTLNTQDTWYTLCKISARIYFFLS